MAGVSACAAPPTVSRARGSPAGRRCRALATGLRRPRPRSPSHRGTPRRASVGQHQRRGPGPAGSRGARPRDACSRAHRWAGGRRPPAVGVFRPNADTTAGRRVRAGDRLGVVDVLGVPQEVAPVDGILGEQLVNGGEAVEYGQDLVVIEFAEAPAMDG